MADPQSDISNMYIGQEDVGKRELKKSSNEKLYPFPVIWWHLANEILGNQLTKHLGNRGKVGFVVFKLDSVDESRKLKDLLPWALVITPQIFRQFLMKKENNLRLF